MGTRGSWGFVLTVDGERKQWETYNHFDSYPSALGQDLLTWGCGVQVQDQWGAVADRVRGLTVVDQEGKPSAGVLAALVKAGIADVGVSTGADWYAALRNGQGNPSITLDSRYWLDGTGFHEDALFCEWWYVFDLDRKIFEVHEGCEKVGGEYTSALRAEIPFDRLLETVLDEDGRAVSREEAPAALDG